MERVVLEPCKIGTSSCDLQQYLKEMMSNGKSGVGAL
jgi:hypothetical protein